MSVIESLPRRAPTLRLVTEYWLLDEVGKGCLGVVPRAYMEGSDQVVALKVLRGMVERLDPQELARFMAEALVMPRLDHPNIVRVLHFGRHEGAPCIAMEYVGGGTL